jgi:hypothetical protein
MRLTEFEISTIKTLTKEHFGQNAEVYLFGSRTIDDKKGGDIDLYINKLQSSNKNYQNKIQFLCNLEMSIGEQKIDVILDDSVDHNSIFYVTIQETAIQL